MNNQKLSLNDLASIVTLSDFIAAKKQNARLPNEKMIDVAIAKMEKTLYSELASWGEAFVAEEKTGPKNIATAPVAPAPSPKPAAPPVQARSIKDLAKSKKKPTNIPQSSQDDFDDEVGGF